MTIIFVIIERYSYGIHHQYSAIFLQLPLVNYLHNLHCLKSRIKTLLGDRS